MAEIHPADLNTRLQSEADGPLVLDIRHSAAYEKWHIPGSRNIDVYDELKDDPEAATGALAELPNEAEIVTVCAAGVISQRATEQLRTMGYDAKTLVDGMNGWSRVHRHAVVDVDVEGTLIQVARPGTGCLSYVLLSNGEAAVFDPSIHTDVYTNIIRDRDAVLTTVFDTHAHADHVSGGHQLATTADVPYHRHPADAPELDVTPLEDGQRFSVGDVEIAVIHTPGHSPGSVTYDVGGVALLTGDTLFHRSVGRVELGVEAGLEGSSVTENAASLHDSLQRLLDVVGDPLVLPSHDPGAPDPPVAKRLRDVIDENPDLALDRDAFVEKLSTDTPDHPPNFERVKRYNVGSVDIPEDDLPELELGPNNCAAN